MATTSVDHHVESRLRSYASYVDQEMAAVLEEQVDDEWLRGAISYHLGWADEAFQPLSPDRPRSGGKKLRPGLALLAYEGARYGSADVEGAGVASLDRAVPFAAALELLHNYSLVHDDVQDRDRSRRGRPTIWALCGEAQAINVGNCMHMLAFGALDRLRDRVVDHPVVAELVAAIARASLRISVGQKLDLAFEREPEVTPAKYLEMIERKTAALLSCATYGGALLALGGQGEEVKARLARFADFGRELGLGFQIRDDILGIWGSEAATGKPAGSDIRRRKKSLPVLFAFQQAPPDARPRLDALYADSSEMSADDEAFVRLLLEETEAEAFAQKQAELHGRQALVALSEAAGGEEALRQNPFLASLEKVAGFATVRSF